MRYKTFSAAYKLVAGLIIMVMTAHAFAEDSVPLKDQLKNCGKCHVGKLALAGKPAENVLASIHMIRDGKRGHPPGLKGFAPEQLAEIAQILTAETSPAIP